MATKEQRIPVPGTSVVAYVAETPSVGHPENPPAWTYTLWENDETVLASGKIDVGVALNADQVAKTAFILEVGP